MANNKKSVAKQQITKEQKKKICKITGISLVVVVFLFSLAITIASGVTGVSVKSMFVKEEEQAIEYDKIFTELTTLLAKKIDVDEQIKNVESKIAETEAGIASSEDNTAEAVEQLHIELDNLNNQLATLKVTADMLEQSVYDVLATVADLDTLTSRIDTLEDKTSIDTGANYTKLSNGLIFQWGTIWVTKNESNQYAQTVSFAKPFTTTNYVVSAQAKYTGGITTSAYNNNTSSYDLTVSGYGGESLPINWIAIGY